MNSWAGTLIRYRCAKGRSAAYTRESVESDLVVCFSRTASWYISEAEYRTD
eukprot:CAMPEP_0172637428 /NCGR_PEP_ID=MMETSP1068-20121228/208875_1 /TAXON_ID=35684 /ORGANISM="Pseudopedinella elastica, Strain CCMP716" /LENGTH=50 /DNA_ID=CAMNT_0013450079 /DNA_START=61 /DNA_END=213 /DNA_ORIENTATION=-